MCQHEQIAFASLGNSISVAGKQEAAQHQVVACRSVLLGLTVVVAGLCCVLLWSGDG